ncbi:cytochrome c biogenesis protein CcsA [Sulfurimonas sp. SAG-AH-194-L11]|nr:cytochrome c biogenesis protein CcsA [Sulfurimonas sp. SAG-AH-194-L11]MDF1877675.1 cytochrome c biogenesis protein CcsA [Sulfurimonas sp. SAG-AH-194-L11]
MKQILSFISSMKTMAILMLIFAFSVGYATIVENDFGTMTAKAEIYNARWFEVLLGLLALNLALNIHKHKMYTLKKAPIFLFHSGFLVILLGAAITRYAGYEGSMHIREGGEASSMVSADTFIEVGVQSAGKSTSTSQKVYLSSRSKNSIDISVSIDDKNVNVNLLEYIPDAVEELVEDKEHGKPIAKFMLTQNGQGKPVALEQGQFVDGGSFIIDFGSGETFSKPLISITLKGGTPYITHDEALSTFRMADRVKSELQANATDELNQRVLYSTPSGGSFVLRDFMTHAVKKLVSSSASSMNRKMKMNSGGIDALRFNVSVGNTSKELVVYGKKGVISIPTDTFIDGVKVNVSYGAKDIAIPFKIHLNDFQLDRYPGSMSPASYASEVTLIDEEEGIKINYRIFMNNILEHRGYRFFQASYDRDEKGTVLSVNNDPGTLPSYLGYLLLAIGMFWSLLSKKHRFSRLAAKAKKASEAKIVPALLAFGLIFASMPSDINAAELDPAIKTILAFDKEHAEKFGELIIQDTQGRMKPMNTLATEILAKIYRGSSLQVGSYSLTPDQVILGMMIRPDIYREVKLIRTKDPKINEAIGAPSDAKYVSFSQFFHDAEGMRGYKLAEIVDEATRKEPKYRNKLDKAALKVDEKVNVAYMVFTGSLLKMWPLKSDETNKWYATIEALQTFNTDDGLKVRDAAVTYFSAVDSALASGDWRDSNDALAEIAVYQKENGSAVYPSANSIKAEIFANNANIFERIYPLYLLMGFILLLLSFAKIIQPKLKMDLITKGALYLLILFFAAHTVGLALRWYISGHAPWSNGYESMVYISWATVLAGFIFSKRSSMTLASTAILSGLILFVAHLNWMNPQVTNLVPVLNSYWLSIHVSMITASYGFLGLGALLGFITLLLFIIKTEKNAKQITLSIKELNSINEMSLMVGLVLLTVGNFLGGVWANESWGRYWGWDPKETWALVTILVYAVVIHLRFLKSLYSEFNFSVISLLSFTSVLMTYFGVNYYLAGMHSYAKGDPVPIPDFVPVTYSILAVVILLAFRNRKIV